GDALLAAKEILATHPQATAEILLVFGEEALRPLAHRSLDRLLVTVGSRASLLPSSAATSLRITQNSWELCLDGVFGFQFRPPMDDATAELLARVNTHPRIKLRAALDLPSGLGDANAGTVFRADFTYATGIVKSPVLAEANAPYVGRVRYLDLGFFVEARSGSTPPVGRGIPDEPATAERVLLASVLRPLAELRTPQSDKRTYGHLLIVGGSRSYPGAVLMTVQAALRSGVGLLTAFVPASLAPEYATHFPEAMWVGMPETTNGGLATSGAKLVLEKLERATALAMGPGLGAESETIELLREVLRNTQKPALLDADALRPEVLAAAQGGVICTPHAGEFERIGGRAVIEKAGAAERIVVLKGPTTRILGRDSHPTYLSFFGGPVLARGGSGDILAGLIGGLLAQKSGDLLLAAARGVVWHGLAADLLARDRGQVAVQTTQLLDYLEPALRFADHETT
ncbi:MAG TPA: NAD(P)H-hydrate dehydratase, partial [Candidatus Didemnitutus sp.]|nr:NAD(P)H-hydrate dehydratase [Candidatus Didemnitutus sp.]